MRALLWKECSIKWAKIKKKEENIHFFEKLFGL